MDTGSSVDGMILPRNIVRNALSRAAVRCTSSDNVAQFVAGHRADPFSRGERLEHQVKRLDADLDEVGWEGAGGAVAVILKILNQDGDLIFGLVAEGPVVKLEGVFE